jgi:hypothetical protein
MKMKVDFNKNEILSSRSTAVNKVLKKIFDGGERPCGKQTFVLPSKISVYC